MTLDSTVGTTTANSYASVAEADAYLAIRGDTSAWTALTDDQKGMKLQWAAIQLETLYFAGNKTKQVQSLEWPRCNVTEKNGYHIYDTVIPVQIKNAQAEFAFQLTLADWTQGLGPITQDSMKVGSISMGRKSHTAWPAAVVAMLKPFLIVMPNSGGRLVRG